MRSTWWCGLSAVVLIVGLGAAIAGAGPPYHVSAANSAAAGVSASLLAGLDGDEPARGIVEAQDRDIAIASGRARSVVKSIVRSPPKVADDDTGAHRKARFGQR